MRAYYTVKQADVGRWIIRAFGRVWPVSGFIGRVLEQDVGKRVYQIGGVLQVENREQFEARKGLTCKG